MNKSIIPTKKPEEEELERKLVELESLKLKLVHKELELNTLQAELHSFELLYLKVVGVKIAKFDDIIAQIAEVFAKIQATDKTASNEAKQSRAQANASAESVKEAQTAQDSQVYFSSSENLKSLFREAAKRIHPDFAVDENDRIRRTKLMVEVNEAYRAGDERKLRRILREWEDSPDTVIGNDIGARLIRTIRQIALIQDRITNLEVEMKRLTETSIYRLKIKVESMNKEVNLALEEMASSIDEQIKEQQKRLDKLFDIYIGEKSRKA